jgi:hypothetical protein
MAELSARGKPCGIQLESELPTNTPAAGSSASLGVRFWSTLRRCGIGNFYSYLYRSSQRIADYEIESFSARSSPGIGCLGLNRVVTGAKKTPPFQSRLRSCLLLRRFQSRTVSFVGKGCIGVGGRPPLKWRQNHSDSARTVKSLKSKTRLLCSMLQIIMTFQSKKRDGLGTVSGICTVLGPA